MIKQFPVILIMLAFTVQTLNKSIIVLNYYTNTASFAKNCENKTRPKLHCNGRCQMMKKMKQEENKDKQNPERRSDNKDEVLYCSLQKSDIIFSNEPALIPFFFLNNSTTKDIPSDFFHPPGALHFL